MPRACGTYFRKDVRGWTLAKTLMVCVVLFKTSTGYGVMPSDEYDGDASCILCEYDPFS